MPALIIHGHFYQPPRENPWTGEVEREPDADPYHDWNERIHAECYGPNASARVVDSARPRPSIINNYARINFNFGPTLFSWLESHHPATYGRGTLRGPSFARWDYVLTVLASLDHRMRG